MNEPNVPKVLSLDMFLKEGDWYDLWHTHVDWKGYGNHGRESRRPFLRALFDLFEQIKQCVSGWSKPPQVWVVIEELDSSQDAVYLHTPNPNRHNFPYRFEGVVWDAELPEWLTEFIDLRQHDAGRCEYNGVISFWIKAKDRGLGP